MRVDAQLKINFLAPLNAKHFGFTVFLPKSLGFYFDKKFGFNFDAIERQSLDFHFFF